MKRNSIHILLGAGIFVLVGLLSSCADDLHQTPISQISSASHWNTEEDANGGLYGMYVRCRGQATDNFFLWGEARSENLAEGFGISTWHNFIFQNTLSRSQPGPIWREMYTVIHEANLLIKNLPDINFSNESTKNSYLAQAYTMRAFIYFMLTRTWGDMPLSLDPTEGYSAELLHRGRVSQAEIFTQIKDDLEKAINLYPNNNFPAGRNTWSKPAANTLKADVYLWTAKRMGGGNADLNVALEALNEAEKGDLALLSDFAEVFDYDNKGNKEIVMAVKFMELESPSQTLFDEMYISGIDMPQNIDEETKEAIGAEGGFAYWAIASHVRTQFSDDDQRKKATFIEIYTLDEEQNKTFYSAVPCKFNGIISGGVRRFYDDVVIYRYADILLMKAEVKNALNQDPSAEINKIRERAYGNSFSSHAFTNGTKGENDKAILTERQLEFTLEGKFWWDLIRFDKVFELVPSLKGRHGDQYLLLWPIAESTLTSEPAVVQNPGWDFN